MFMFGGDFNKQSPLLSKSGNKDLVNLRSSKKKNHWKI